ncbi:hypothetical protein B4U80_14563, partial [Leptotrombidium deliense]
EMLPDLLNSTFTNNISFPIRSEISLQSLREIFSSTFQKNDQILRQRNNEKVQEMANNESTCDNILRNTIVAYATIKGYAAARDPKIGSLFISSLNKVLKSKIGFRNDIFDILRNVQSEMLSCKLPQ